MTTDESKRDYVATDPRSVASIKVGEHVVYTARDMLSLEDSGDRWIVPHLIPKEGRVLVFGEGGDFKTTILFDLCVAIASANRSLFSKFKIDTYGPALVISTEGNIFDSRRRIFSHARAHNVNPGELPLYFSQEPFLLDDPTDLAALDTLIDHIRPLIVVLDPLDSFFMGEENSSKETKPIRTGLNAIIRKYGCTVVLIHHAAKNKDTPRGTSAFYGWADAVLYVKAKPYALKELPDGEELKVVSVVGQKMRNGKGGHKFSGVPMIDEARDLVTFSFYENTDYSGVVLTYFKKRVYELLRTGGPQTTEGLVQQLGEKTRARVKAALDSLEIEQLVDHRGMIPVSCGNGPNDTRRVKAWRALQIKTIVDLAQDVVHSELEEVRSAGLARDQGAEMLLEDADDF